ncbi:hypothetical protein [Microbulbifer aggregans]|uniref:hypothetical protein n=1 Tax=Microbulbifer aggregans TaxID=1769779 RepID=UPI001CFD286A|nr:hypothetical protein [Microbulbifer aggregans]
MIKPQVQADRNSRNVKENANLIQGERRPADKPTSKTDKLAPLSSASSSTRTDKKKPGMKPGKKKV